ncbi:unnamed protein product [Anisakis simplex]|uniref:Gamma-tubulin complex component n=1 Tax=Anisakis simplex TaxID=6269 RepID=A0A0M3J3J3_ANISI|nr:unnamed protein product [Anisakis simplex]
MVDGNQINTDFTSTYSKLFLEKMALLNRTFLEVLEDHVREIPDADLSPTIQDYLKHVENLDRIYGSSDHQLADAPSSFAFGSKTNGSSEKKTTAKKGCFF